eukprot:CAMPEP_0172306734 /NCGR_PEP_ID=MMETSP1058-20130122/7741_1 /TAXON_ID=83371 /ORGANISM="Detonula confervacea, Strain CCMP 353" /LENGTH=182 /DNA_ID=CAMNT_0013018711 /DNA_START=59 /DNA_END=607 /DNA_ORIENTATION=-
MTKLSTMIMPLTAAILFYTAEAFAPATRTSLPRVSSAGSGVVASRNSFQLRASEGGDEDVGMPTLPSQQKGVPLKIEPAPVQPAAPVVTTDVVEEELRSYPIDLPSPALLATSMFLMISSIGSVFELAGGTTTKLGFGPTAALAAIGFPISVFLIYAAIMKGAAETEEDDKEYENSRPRGRL